jgi:4-aminobutyrate aminotransferase-like enzyme
MLDRVGDFPGVAAASQQEIWKNVSPDPNLILRIPESRFPPEPLTGPAILRLRGTLLGRNLRVSYRRPLTIVRGYRQHLYDADGRRYLDAVNNVAHVGHSHPRVVRDVSAQLAVLNTNTRYLHGTLVRYAQRLVATMPDPLRVCFLVSSGSEANELALRLAHSHTGHRGIVVVDGAYHGNTTSLIDISPYKCEGPGGRGLPSHVQKVAMPDTFRGRYAGRADAGPLYATHVDEAIVRLRGAGHRPAAFFCESLLSCGGQIVLPPGYLARAYGVVREAGGLAIADEVQTGFGRVGTHMWAFETQGVVPDIVTLGKPIGNGFPLGAVVTRPEIAASFANGMEYFNTYGGNPVACAAGLAVLDVLGDERLQEHALRVGSALRSRLDALKATFPLIGDVRGLGLFIGVDLVRDRRTLEPAADQAGYVVNRLRDRGVLLSTDGPAHNVLKIKPPLVFDDADADLLIDTLETVLGEDPAQPE